MRINLVLATSLWEPHQKAGKLLSVPLALAAAAPGAAMAPRQGLDVDILRMLQADAGIRRTSRIVSRR